MDSDQTFLHALYSAQDLLDGLPSDQGIPMTSAILAYEIGDLIKCAMNQHWGGVRGYQGEATLALADVITMSRLLAALLKIDYWDCLRMGEERYIEATSIRETRRLDTSNTGR